MISDKFSVPELAALRKQLLNSGSNANLGAELLLQFVVLRGYGISFQAAQHAANRVDAAGYSMEVMQLELDQVALVQ